MTRKNRSYARFLKIVIKSDAFRNVVHTHNYPMTKLFILDINRKNHFCFRKDINISGPPPHTCVSRLIQLIEKIAIRAISSWITICDQFEVIVYHHIIQIPLRWKRRHTKIIKYNY